MSKTQTYYFSGTCKWAKLKEKDAKYDNWQIVLYPTAESLQDYAESGIQVDVKEDADGKNIKFRREATAEFKDRDTGRTKIIDFLPPAVLAADRKTPLDALVGNGSKVTVKVEAFPTRNGIGHRMVAVVVEDLVEYDPDANKVDSAALPF